MSDDNLNYDVLPRIYPHEEWMIKKWVKDYNSRKPPIPTKVTNHVDAAGKPYKTLWKKRG